MTNYGIGYGAFVGSNALQMAPEYKQSNNKKRFGGDDPDYTPLVLRDLPAAKRKKIVEPVNLDPDLYRTDLDNPDRQTLGVINSNNTYVYKDSNGKVVTAYHYEMPKLYQTVYGYRQVTDKEKQDMVKAKRKQLDFVGGDNKETHNKMWSKLPITKAFVDSIAIKYGISPELLTERLNHEGFVNEAVKKYNYLSNIQEQKDFDKNLLSERNVYNGFHDFGLDNTGTYLDKRLLNLRDSVDYWTMDAENEDGIPVLAADAEDVRGNIILQAATLEYMKKLMKDRGIPKDKLETWTNAAYNMGPNAEELKDSTFVEKNYNFNKKRMGGKHNANNKELGSNNSGFYSVTDRGKTKYYMIPSTGNSSARSAEVRTKKVLGGINDFDLSKWYSLGYAKPNTTNEVVVTAKKQPLSVGIPKLTYTDTNSIVNNYKMPYKDIKADKTRIMSKPDVRPVKDMPNPMAGVNTEIKPITIATPDYSKFNQNNKINKQQNTNNWWTDNKSNIISDSIGLVSNIAGSLISHSMNKNMLNRLKPAPQPIARQATKLKTQININPQLDKMRETVAAYERNIDNNTSSSNVALARKQNARLANVLNTNELYGTKENIETEFINKDRLNQQSVSEKNVTDYNKWSTDVANFRNAVLEQKANNDVSLVNNLNAGIQNMLTVRDKRNAENQTIAAMALSNPNLPIEMFFEQGLINRKLYNAYKKAYPKTND